MFVCAGLARHTRRTIPRDASLRLSPGRVFTIELSAGFDFFDAAHLSAAAFSRRTDKKGIRRDRRHNPFLRQSAGRTSVCSSLPQELRDF
jgi:hypothetical protein